MTNIFIYFVNNSLVVQAYDLLLLNYCTENIPFLCTDT